MTKNETPQESNMLDHVRRVPPAACCQYDPGRRSSQNTGEQAPSGTRRIVAQSGGDSHKIYEQAKRMEAKYKDRIVRDDRAAPAPKQEKP